MTFEEVSKLPQEIQQPVASFLVSNAAERLLFSQSLQNLDSRYHGSGQGTTGEK